MELDLGTSESFAPLAARMRPVKINQYFGQQHIVGSGKPLRKAIENGQVHSMILWGPPGTGKTTLAELVASHCDAHIERISAVTSGVKEIRAAIEMAKQQAGMRGKRTILFVDEVHRFNKSQQDAFLPYIENGTVTFIGATTENPSFELNNALLSRARVYLLQSLNESDLAGLMVGSSPMISERPPYQEPGEAMLAIEGLGTLDDRFLPAVKNLNLTIKSGEIVGIAGVSGNGQREMAQAIAGLRPITSGKVIISGKDLTNAPPSESFTAGLGYVPEDRLGVGLAPRLTVTENAILRCYKNLRKSIFLVSEQTVNYCKEIIDRFGVRTGPIDEPIAGLSGGNLQRLLVGRELSGNPKVVLAAQPTRGLDVQGVKAIQDLLIDERADGVAVLLISEDLDELLTLSDRLLVMHEGEIVKEFDPTTAHRHEIGAAMAGKRDES